jgi:hypothetical protein
MMNASQFQLSNWYSKAPECIENAPILVSKSAAMSAAVDSVTIRALRLSRDTAPRSIIFVSSKQG